MKKVILIGGGPHYNALLHLLAEIVQVEECVNVLRFQALPLPSFPTMLLPSEKKSYRDFLPGRGLSAIRKRQSFAKRVTQRRKSGSRGK